MMRPNHTSKVRFVCSLVLVALVVMPASAGETQDRSAWMQEARWGVMNHYLADWIARNEKIKMDVTIWNDLIDRFDVEGLAKQIESVCAGYYLITIGQNSGYYLSPNATYDRYVVRRTPVGGIRPSKCSRRDLVADLYEALQKRGIKLMVYLPAGAPGGDRTAREALQWQRGAYRNREFQLKWEKVIREWSLRWGKKVAGWWFDGCYWPNSMYRYSEPPNFGSFAAAARVGNPAGVVAFNPGVYNRLRSLTPHEDYLAGEINEPDAVDLRRLVNGKHDGVQVHVLSYLGQRWGTGSTRFSTENVVKWSRERTRNGCILTWDVPIQSNGLMSQPFMNQLTAVGKALGR